MSFIIVFLLLQFFDTNKNETTRYYTSSTVELTQFVKINVTMHVSGSPTTCLRFELYGCDTGKTKKILFEDTIYTYLHKTINSMKELPD